MKENAKKDKYIPVINGKEATKVKVSDIVMLYKVNRKLCIVTDEEEFTFSEQIEKVSGMLDSRFYCCLKGYYVNLEKIVSMSERNIYFENGMVFTLGRESYFKTKQRYKLYLKKMTDT